jgi:biotin carboxyl carrier protein
MRTYKLTIDDKSYEVEVKTFNLKEATLVVNGKTLAVQVDDVVSAVPKVSKTLKDSAKPMSAPASTPRVANGPGPAPAGGDGVKAPIPGAILSINVSEGDTVEAGQLLLTMEAMKMENQIKAPKGGKVTQLCVQPGDAVAQGQDLLIIE